MKKKLITLFIFILLLVTGCGSASINSSPEAVAQEMAKRLSNGNYKNIRELLAVDENAFITEEAFQEYLSENNLVIEGNTKYEVDNSSEITDDSTSSVVRIKIDNNKILKVNTIKKDDKWYVDLGSDKIDNNLIIKVPTGSTVKLNGIKLDYKKYGETDNFERYWSIGGSRYDYSQSMDIYTIPSLLKGKYDLQVEGSSFETIIEEIYSNKVYYQNYMESDDKIIFNSDRDSYVVFTKANSNITSELKKFIENYYNDVMKQAEAGNEFSTISKYYANNDTLIQTYKKSYENLSNNMIDTSYYTWTTYHSDLKGTFTYSGENDGVYYINENQYIVVSNYTMSYTATTKYKSSFYKDAEDKIEEKKMDKTVVVSVTKDSKGQFVIDGGIKIIPSFKSYE